MYSSRGCVLLYMCRPAENWMFCPAVPPSPPVCRIPSSVTTGKKAELTCHDGDGSPAPTYRWYKDGTLLPPEPQKMAGFQNATYVLNPTEGKLVSYKFLLCIIFTSDSSTTISVRLKLCPVCLLRCFPGQPRQTQVCTTVRLSTMLVLLRAVKPRKWKFVSVLLFNFRIIVWPELTYSTDVNF